VPDGTSSVGNGTDSVADTPSRGSSLTGRSGASDNDRGKRGSEGLADGVVLGVDTHLDFHVAVVWPAPWRGQSSNDREGLRETRPLAEGFGLMRSAGVEGTGSYGAGLAHLHPRHRRHTRLRDSRPRSDHFSIRLLTRLCQRALPAVPGLVLLLLFAGLA
jgi:hypothetical protein